MQLSTGEIVFASGMIILAILVLWFVPKRQVQFLAGLAGHERLKIENETRKVIAEILGGAFVLIGLFFTWQTIKNTAENLRIAQEGQNTERFMKAIEQLGKADEAPKSNNLAIRLGGIYSLEQLARDSERDYYWPIMEVLTAYVREHAAWSEIEKDAPPDQVSPPATDIQTILDVLKRRKRSYNDGEDQRLDLSVTDLRRADLTGANFNGAKLDGVRLYRATLKGIHLKGASLINADLTRAILDQADLEGADLTGAILDNTVLTGANLKGVKGLNKEQLQSAETNDKTRLP